MTVYLRANRADVVRDRSINLSASSSDLSVKAYLMTNLISLE